MLVCSYYGVRHMLFEEDVYIVKGISNEEARCIAGFDYMLQLRVRQSSRSKVSKVGRVISWVYAKYM